MLTISPIGSCRITGPLRHGQEAHGIGLNLTRCYGYCHSPAEAVQMARFMRGDIGIAADVWPLVSRNSTHGAMARQPVEPSDLYVIELASAKELTVDGVSVQLNYVNSTYRAFFSETARAQEFWALAETDDRAPLARFLERTWARNAAQREEAKVLSRIRLRFVTRDGLRRDIATLAGLLPQVLFVTHVDALKPDGQPIGSRSGFIDLVTEEVTGAGLACFNPTDLMAEFGQAEAIEDHSTSLAHFTPAFIRAIMDDWMQSVVAPATDRAVRDGASDRALTGLSRQIAAAHQMGRFVQARTRLERLAEDTGQVEHLLDETQRRQAEAHAVFEGKFAALTEGRLAEADLAGLVEEAAMLGLAEAAAQLAAAEGAEMVPAHVLMKAARHAAEAGEADAAFALAYAALCRDDAFAPACRLLGELATGTRIAGFAACDEEHIGWILAHLAPLDQLAALGMQGILVTAAISPATSPGDLAAMVADLSERDRLEDAIALIARWRVVQEADRLRDAELVAILDGWVAAAMGLEAPAHRVQALSAIIEADPRHPGLRNALRDLKVDFIARTRAAGKGGDLAALEALRKEARLFPTPLPEFDFWQARLRYGVGEFDTALELGRSAAEHLPQNINVWVLLMRAAASLNMGAAARDYAGKVVALASDKSERLKAEAEAVLAAEDVRA